MSVPRRRSRLTRDGLVTGVALVWGTVEIVFFGARVNVLALVGSVLLSPLLWRLDENLKRRNGAKDE